MSGSDPGPPPASRRDDAVPVAAVDLGSNSFHMVIARMVEPDLQILDRLREPVRLAAGLENRSRLRRNAKERAIAALERFGQRLSDLSSDRVRAVGTSTLRLASADTEFREAAHQALGHPIEVISGQEEARLIYQGISHTNPDPGGMRLAIDIGGGSTEVMIGEGFDLRRAHSLGIGCVSMSREFFPDGVIDRERFRSAQTAVALEFRAIREELRELGWSSTIGSSGTINAISEMLRLGGAGSGEITFSLLKQLRRDLVESGSADSLDLPGLRPDRAPVIAGGLAILIGCFKNLHIDTMVTSVGALREGVLYDLVGRLAHRDVRDRTVRRLVDRFQVDLGQAERVRRTALGLLEALGDSGAADPLGSRKLLSWAALLHESGLVVAHSGYHKHGAYLVANIHFPGFSSDDQELLALLVRGHRRRFPLEEIEATRGVQKKQALELVLILRIAVLLHRSRSATPVPTPGFTRRGKRWTLRFSGEWLEEHPLTRADLESEVERLAAVGVTLETAL